MPIYLLDGLVLAMFVLPISNVRVMCVDGGAIFLFYIYAFGAFSSLNFMKMWIYI